MRLYPEIKRWTNIVSRNPDDKPFTSYSVAFTPPVRDRIPRHLDKRYSEFVALDRELRDAVGYAPPAQLPSKVMTYWPWIRTGNSVAANRRTSPADDRLIAARARQLAKYLDAIDASVDPVWRSTLAWRSFWDLAPEYDMAASVDEVPILPEAVTHPFWLELVKQVESTLDLVAVVVAEQRHQARTQESHPRPGLGFGSSSSSATDDTATNLINKAVRSIDVLSKSLRMLIHSNAIGKREHEARANMLEKLRATLKEREVLVSRQQGHGQTRPSHAGSCHTTITTTAAAVRDRSSPATSIRKGRPLGGGSRAPDDDAVTKMSNQELLDHNDERAKDIDSALPALLSTAERMKRLAYHLSGQLDVDRSNLTNFQDEVDEYGNNLSKRQRDLDRLRKGK